MDYGCVGVVGLGHVGLPIALRFAAEGRKAVGIDVNRHLISRLLLGETALVEKWRGRTIQEILASALSTGLLTLSDNPESALADCTDCVITVGIPVSDGMLDFEPFKAACVAAIKGLGPGGLLLVRSTVPAGTMETVVLPLIQDLGRSIGTDLLVAYCPERMAEGSAMEEVSSLPLVVAAQDDKSMERATKLLGSLGVRECVPTRSFRLAELVKTVENASRDVNIALASEVGSLCRGLGVDTAQLIRAANTHPRVRMLQPGPGVGGFCLPNAHYYLAHAARQLGVPLTLTAQARAVNDRVPAMVADLVERGIERIGKRLAAAKVAVLGVAMKDFCGDDRLSPVYPFVDHLIRRGATVSAFDPAVTSDFPGKVSTRDDALTGADAVVITARQTGIDLDLAAFAGLMRTPAVIVDTRDVIDRTAAESLGFLVVTI